MARGAPGEGPPGEGPPGWPQGSGSGRGAGPGAVAAWSPPGPARTAAAGGQLRRWARAASPELWGSLTPQALIRVQPLAGLGLGL